MIAKDIDPKQACVTMGICSATAQFDNVRNFCIEILKSIVILYLV